MKKAIKHGGDLTKFVAGQILAPEPKDVKPLSLIPHAIRTGIYKLKGGRTDNDLSDRAALALSSSARKEVDNAKDMLANKRLQEYKNLL